MGKGLSIPTVEALLRDCADFATGRLLDVGCGSKPYESLFTRVRSYIGLDLSSASQADVVAAAMNLPFRSDSFDTVLSTQVLEHVPEPWVTIEEMYRVLRPNGCLLLSAPQTCYLHGEPHDYYRFTKHGLQYLLERSGFVVEDTMARGGFWCTVGYMFIRYVTTISPSRRLDFTTKPLVFLVNAAAPLLDNLRFWPTDTIGYVAIARKPG